MSQVCGEYRRHSSKDPKDKGETKGANELSGSLKVLPWYVLELIYVKSWANL